MCLLAQLPIFLSLSLFPLFPSLIREDCAPGTQTPALARSSSRAGRNANWLRMTKVLPFDL